MWWIVGISGWIIAGGVGASLMGHAVRRADHEDAAELNLAETQFGDTRPISAG